MTCSTRIAGAACLSPNAQDRQLSDRGEMLYTLLDFLRLRADYDRLAWNLRPVVLAHEVLVRGGNVTGGATTGGCL